MAIYTKIPEMDFAGAMAKALSGVIGPIQSKASEVLNDVQAKLQTSATEAFKEARSRGMKNLQGKNTCLESYESVLDKSSKALNTIEGSFNSISSTVNALRASVEALKAPVEALKAAILVIKMIPIPQMYLVVSITTVFSDTLEMLSELVAQVSESVESVTTMLDTVDGAFDIPKSILEQLKTVLTSLQSDQALQCAFSDASDSDIENLQNLGIIDSVGDSIFNKLGQDPLEKGYVSFGDINVTEDQITKLNYIQNNSGNSSTSDIDSKGLTNGDEHGSVAGKDLNIVNLKNLGQDGIYLIQSESDIYDLINHMLSKIDDASYIGSSIKDSLSVILNNYPKSSSSENDSEQDMLNYTEQYVSSNGETYTLSVVKDSASPKIAIRHYAIAKNMNGVVVLTGVKSFTLDAKNLIQALKVQLSQISI